MKLSDYVDMISISLQPFRKTKFFFNVYDLLEYFKSNALDDAVSRGLCGNRVSGSDSSIREVSINLNGRGRIVRRISVYFKVTNKDLFERYRAGAFYDELNQKYFKHTPWPFCRPVAYYDYGDNELETLATELSERTLDRYGNKYKPIVRLSNRGLSVAFAIDEI